MADIIPMFPRRHVRILQKGGSWRIIAGGTERVFWDPRAARAFLDYLLRKEPDLVLVSSAE